MKTVSKTFAVQVERLTHLCPDNIERHEAIRKLLEAKDCAVRSLLFKPDAEVKVHQ